MAGWADVAAGGSEVVGARVSIMADQVVVVGDDCAWEEAAVVGDFPAVIAEIRLRTSVAVER